MLGQSSHMRNQRTLERAQINGGSQQAMGNVRHQTRREGEKKSYHGLSHTLAVDTTRKDLIFAYYNLNRQQRIWSCPCSVLLVFAALLAVGCGVLRLISFIYERNPEAMDSEVVVMNDFSPLGCFPLFGNDAPSNQTSEEFMVRDTACLDPEKNGLRGQLRCRSGLPFYRFSTGKVMPWRWCAKLCLLKGFDISGVVDAKECRCGASEQNLQVWAKDVMPREDLHFDTNSGVLPDASSCRIVAAEYLGPLPVEAWRSDVTEADLTYIRSIVSSSVISTLEREVPAKSPIAGVAPPTLQPGKVVVNYTREAEKSSCSPGPCASGWPWPIWTVYRSGVPFAYDETVLPSTKASVQQAIRRLQQMTCVKFTEVSLSFGLTWKIVVTERYAGPCFASVLGYSGIKFNDSEVNLKTCAQNVGVVMHELGHALGMSHEQSRQDRDKYIRINWMHVTKDYLEQYYTSPTSYIGSKDMGFVPYDYRSVMQYSANPAMHSLPMVNGQGVHDGSMGQRNDFSPWDVVQLRDMYQCDALDLGCADHDEAVGNLLSTTSGQKADCKRLKDAGYCQDKTFGETISYFCAKTCGVCPKLDRGVEGHKEHIERAACVDEDETVCKFLEDYCPGKGTSGLEQYMSMHCQKRCCLQSCNKTCQYPSEEEAAAAVPAVPVVKGPSVAMDITFDCPRYETERLLQQRLQLRFSRLLGAGITVTLLKAPSCLQGCQHGEARVEQLCCPECVQTCSELRKKWVILTPKELSAFSGAFRVVVQGKTVDVPFTWEDITAYATQNRAFMYIAAALSALGLLSIVLTIAFLVWWKRASSTPADGEVDVDLFVEDEAPKDTEIGGHWAHTEHAHISQRELGQWLHQHEEASNEFLPHGWCWRHRTALVVCVCVAAVASAGLMLYVDLTEPASSGVLKDSAPPPSSSAPVFKYMGCFTADMPAASPGLVDLYDNTCMRTGNSCGGLPFYRFRTSDGRTCAEFCLSKGLDLSGLLDGSECRCGASAHHAIWQATPPRPDLQWSATKVPSSSPKCRIDAMRLSGPVTDIFETLRSNDLQEKDLRYISGIVRGLLIEPPKPVPGKPARQMKEKVIPFSFVEPVPQETKGAFRQALDEVARSTCISFYETNGTESKIRVHGYGSLCEASQVGWSQGVDLYMGWCCTSFHLGAILHELGHALGLINEEQRSDRGIFVAEPSLPISGVGPLYYDFGSVMHGPATSLPMVGSLGVHDTQIGQRRGLSALDVLKLEEIYDCGSPPHEIKVGICQQLKRHCKRPRFELWMSKNCGEICEPPVQRWLGFSFAFSTPGGFDLNNPTDQKDLGDGFAVGIGQALGVSNTTVQVVPGEATVEVACGCQGVRGRACRSCSTLEALLLRSSQQTLQRWLQQGGFAQLEVLSYKVTGEGVIWLLQDSRVQIGLCFVGTLSATLAIAQAVWYLWWTRKEHVEAEASDGE